MALKRKQKALSPEELKEKLITQSGEFWLHSEPLLGFIPQQDGPKFFSLSPQMDGVVVVFLLDVGDYVSERVLETLGGWRERYRNLHWKAVLAFQQKYLFVKNPKFLERYRHSQTFTKTPVYLDPLGEWFESFQTKNHPEILLFNQGNLIFKEKLLPDYEKSMLLAEHQLQDVLRLDDPGLPLSRVPTDLEVTIVDQKIILNDALAQSGYWVQANSSLVTDDSHAALSFPFEGKHLRLLGVTHPQARETTRIQIFLNGEALPAIRHGENVHFNDKGLTIMDINKNTGIYELVRSDEVLKGTIQIKFMNAHENPVILYELRSA